MKLILGIAALLALAISERMAEPEDSLPTTMPALIADTVCPGQTRTLIIAIYGPMIYTAPYIIVLMQSDSL